jgi:uncharacterized protein (DUF983 family)
MHRDGQDQDVEALKTFEPVIQEVIAGRIEGHKCPFCREGDLECTFDGLNIKIVCKNCGKFFEGMLA